jgi:hypothetical protein
MTQLEKILSIALGALALSGAVVGWWVMHNHTEQKLGAQKCITSTTEVKAAVIQDDTGIEAAHAAQISKVVQTYEQKLHDASTANASLAGRLHDYAFRQSTVPGARSAACPSSPDPGLPASQSPADPGLGRVTADTQSLLDACDADHGKVTLVTDAYNDWRQRMIEANAAQAK